MPEIPGVLAEERSESVGWFISRHNDKHRGTETQRHRGVLKTEGQRGTLTQRIAEIKHREKQRGLIVA